MGLLLSFPGIQVRRTLRAAGSVSSRSIGGSGWSTENQGIALIWQTHTGTHTHAASVTAHSCHVLPFILIISPKVFQ